VVDDAYPTGEPLAALRLLLVPAAPRMWWLTACVELRQAQETVGRAGTWSVADKFQRGLVHFERVLDDRYAEVQTMHTKHDAHVVQVYERLVAADAAATKAS
jgi:hypothetical protein